MYKLNKKRHCLHHTMMVCVITLGTLGTNSFASDGTKAEHSQTPPHIGNPAAADVINTTTKLSGQAGDSDDLMVDLKNLTMTVYKSPTCGCCRGWVDYMKAEGFSVKSVDTDDMTSVKSQLGLTAPELHSCHTAVIDGYVIEGHVPADDVKRLLTEKPDLLALTAPGMPMMSPGMASRIPQDYDVLSVDKDGDIELWSAY